MYIIGENIHIISEKVKEALKNRDSEFFMELALKQVEAGAKAVDINLGPRKKDWEEITEDVFKKVFKDSAVKRTKFSGLKRNINFLKD